MVRRRALITAAAAAAAVVVASAAAAPAGAASRKVALSDYRWSTPAVRVDLGETVTWIWAGPDTRHSVTPVDASTGLPDSDPQPVVRTHRVGDRFSIRFTAPGTYAFRCRLHGSVGGTVTVSDVPGTDAPSPDPEPVLRRDRTAPRATHLRAAGGVLRLDLDEAARLDLDIAEREGGLVRTLRRRGHPGRNRVRFGRLAPGSYEVRVRPTDAAGNRGDERRVLYRVRRASPDR